MATFYSWGSRSFGVDAQIVGEVVETISTTEGRCEPGQLVDAARDKTSPLHSLFTWDDTKAAESWRTHEARRVISAIVVNVTVEDNEVTAPAFVSVGHVLATQGAGEGYRSISVITAHADFTKEALDEAKMRLRAIQRRYAALEALAPVWEALEAVEAAD